MPTFRTFALTVIACALASSMAWAQAAPDFRLTSASQERISENHLKLVGNVELEQKDMKLYTDELDYFSDQDRAVATGNVVFTQGTNRIAADRADFNVKTRLGTFYAASGIANIKPPRRPVTPGAFAAPALTSSIDTDVYFFGEIVEKIGPRRYKITNGGFSTCVQPTPRWNLNADSVVLNIDHYTVLRNAILNVKGVPLLYLPVLYYPTKEDDRATGFLIPTYGSSSLRGQAIHNAFFWAINRSQDATFMHEWYSKAGNGYGGEYRYNVGGGSDGIVSAHLLDQTGALPESQAYEIRGTANQLLPGHLRARARVDYFSSLRVNQTFNTNVYDASRNSRTYGANVVGAWRTFSLNGTYDRNEYFYDTRTSGVLGNSPRVSLSRNERPLFAGAPLYFSANTEFVHLDRQTRQNDAVIDDSSLGRFDFMPQVRYPFNRWQWLTVNSSLSWRDTFYSRSYDVTDPTKPIITDGSLNRRYFTVQAQLVGPVFTRIFNTPDNGYAERFKHTIEPFLNVQRTSSIENFSQIVQIDGVDTIVGNTTNYTYGINNRIYAKRRIVEGRPSLAQEMLSVELVQTYYTSPLASAYDTRYSTSFGSAQPNNFSPVALSVRATPTTSLNGTIRLEFDSHHKELRTFTANTSYNWSNRIQSQVGWSKRFFIEGLSGFNDRQSLDNYINVSTNAHTADNRYGIIHSFNYDILRSGMLQQRISGFYNAQCCGIAMEYQTYSYAGVNSVVPADHRFFLSFTLAGLGNFSPFNGALSGVPH